MSETAVWTRDILCRIFPHAADFMFLERAWRDGEGKILAQLDMEVAVPFFRSHIPARGERPARPTFPGALLIEVASEVCGLFYEEDLMAGRLPVLREVEGFKWGQPIKPGDAVVIAARDLDPRRGISRFEVEVMNGTERVARGKINAVFMPEEAD